MLNEEAQEVAMPARVKRYGKIVCTLTKHDLELLHRMSRMGHSLEEIANQLPSLWFYQQRLREPILERFLLDPWIKKCVHPNLGTGECSPLQKGRTDVPAAAIKLEKFEKTFRELREILLGFSQVRLDALLLALQMGEDRADDPKRSNGRTQRRLSDDEIRTRILEACRDKPLSVWAIYTTVRMLANRAREVGKPVREHTLSWLEQLASEGLGELSGEGHRIQFRSHPLKKTQ